MARKPQYTREIEASRVSRCVFALIAAAAILALRSTDWLASLGGRVTGARLDRVRRSPEYRDGKFRNTEPSRMISGSYRKMFRRQFFGREKREPAGPIPVVRRVTADYAKAPPSSLRATWIGWASVLVEIDGRIILTDPVWSERCSPSTLVGPKRFHGPPIALGDAPADAWWDQE
jgi:hypothetical protein